MDSEDPKQYDKARLQDVQANGSTLRRSSRSHARADLQNVQWVTGAIEQLTGLNEENE